MLTGEFHRSLCRAALRTVVFGAADFAMLLVFVEGGGIDKRQVGDEGLSRHSEALSFCVKSVVVSDEMEFQPLEL